MTDQIMQLETTIRNEVDSLNPSAIVIKSQEDRDSVSRLVRDARAIRSRVENFFKDMKANAYKTWKSICDIEKSYTSKCDSYEQAANKSILEFDRKVKEEQDRLEREAEARRQAEEKARKDAEAAQQLAEDAEDDSTVEERVVLLRESQEAERKAAEERAAAERARAQTFVRKAEGESVRTTWKARVVDANLVPREYLIVDQKMLDAVVKSKKEQISQGQFKVPGIEFYEDRTIVRKSGC